LPVDLRSGPVSVDGEAGGRSLLGQDGQCHGAESEENLGRHDSASILQDFTA
jgi:hypothetical protein